MAVFLGCQGRIELRRTTTQEVYSSVVNPSDVNPDRNRFSFDFDAGMLLTGDQIYIKATDGKPLDFIAPSGWPTNEVYRDGLWFLNVDEVGGIRLYRKFDEAIAGEIEGRVDLRTPSRNIPITVEVRSNIERILGQVTSFEFNTERNAVDVTSLSEDFKRHYSGLISGSGRIECFFDYQRLACDPAYQGASTNAIELPRYMNELILRTRLGSEFWARLYLVSRGPKEYGSTDDVDDEVYYEIDGVTTNVGMAFEPSEPIRTTVEFVTTGRIHFRTKTVSNFLLQENYGRLRQEENQTGFIEVEQQE
jgi:hypothetical protein